MQSREGNRTGMTRMRSSGEGTLDLVHPCGGRKRERGIKLGRQGEVLIEVEGESWAETGSVFDVDTIEAISICFSSSFPPRFSWLWPVLDPAMLTEIFLPFPLPFRASFRSLYHSGIALASTPEVEYVIVTSCSLSALITMAKALSTCGSRSKFNICLLMGLNSKLSPIRNCKSLVDSVIALSLLLISQSCGPELLPYLFARISHNFFAELQETIVSAISLPSELLIHALTMESAFFHRLNSASSTGAGWSELCKVKGPSSRWSLLPPLSFPVDPLEGVSAMCSFLRYRNKNKNRNGAEDATQAKKVQVPEFSSKQLFALIPCESPNPKLIRSIEKLEIKKMRNQKNSKESRLSRCMKAPIRFLSKARDFYIHGMTECSGRFAYVDAAMGCPAGQLSALPRSFSLSSSTRSTSADDYKDLVRAASMRRTYNNGNGHPLDFDRLRRPPPQTVPRSRSVAIGRIDEDKPCDFGDDVAVKPNVYPRSKSYGVHRRSASGVL
ncbi:Uncharacterized conserved protein UCP031279 [Senna tora]|uniref:Uncharacterized conserved protein UCP031279 n=1 Tax=Senna tora TaxID=362788 RepID=A0A834WMA1_9FABA|nr:Uncharacterized conserved protein UCP031279 [Senna tora]